MQGVAARKRTGHACLP